VAALRPVLECVTVHGDGTVTAAFDYDNDLPTALSVAVGAQNGVWPAPADRGQPQVFEPGAASARPGPAFSVRFPSDEKVTWTLGPHTVAASAMAASCHVVPPPPPETGTVGVPETGSPGVPETGTAGVPETGTAGVPVPEIPTATAPNAVTPVTPGPAQPKAEGTPTATATPRAAGDPPPAPVRRGGPPALEERPPATLAIVPESATAS